ncbi:MAG: hypothetical protein EOO62_29200 [Hymenobacter sp.]|nr:MAG: hypothetical protein EOO62_29200 [Hymenobacter sp.]
MVAPALSSVPADGLAIYQSVVRRAIDVFTAIIALYEPDIHSERDWADITVSEATGQRRELQLRLLATELRGGDTVTLVGTIGHYTDTHWADYERIMPNLIKRQQVLQLHATLESLIKEIAPLSNALKAQARGQLN